MSGSNYAKIALEFGGEDIDADFIKGIADEWAYQGFDPIKIMEIIKTRGEDGWKEDCVRMIVLNLTRGNKPDKMLTRMSESGKARLNVLIKKYKLKSGKPGKDDLTLARVSAVLAPWTCKAIAHLENMLPVVGSAMDNHSPSYPRPMMHPSFGGLIDSSLNKDDFIAIVEAHKLFLFHFAQVINKDLRGKSKAEVEASFDQPLKAAMGSTFFSDKEKRAVLVDLGLINLNGKPNEHVRRAAEKYRQLA
ncbi:nucleoprotein [Mudanjiang phlebovirus]|nr:nucleoprotein [Mudanjiang phlebovirus]